MHAYNPKGREKKAHNNFSSVSDLVTPRERDRNLHKAECSHVAQHGTPFNSQQQITNPQITNINF